LSQHCINTFYSQQFLKIYHLYYKNHQLVHHLFLKQKKKQFFLYSIKDLAKFQNKIKTLINPLLLLETNQGILTHPEALKLRIGGQLMGIFYRYTKF
jgi:ribosomal protein S8